MKICILDGDMQQGESSFSDHVDAIANALRDSHELDVFRLKNMQLNHCIGCWTCWWETPGLCVQKDDAGIILRSLINADRFVFASPLVAGFTSSLLKRITERLIVLLHPYVILLNGESRHRKHYDRYPDFGLLLQEESDTDAEDIQIVKDIYDRLALNFHARNRFMKFVELDHIEDIANAIVTD